MLCLAELALNNGQGFLLIFLVGKAYPVQFPAEFFVILSGFQQESLCLFTPLLLLMVLQ